MANDPVLRSRLVCFARLFDAPPAFVLPVFVGIGTDQPYLIQDVALDGTIGAFVPVDLGDLSTHQIAGEVVYREVGEPSLLGFEFQVGQFDVADRLWLATLLKESLSDPKLKENPFTRAVVANFCGDLDVANGAEVDALARLSTFPCTQSYYRVDVLSRDVINRALREVGRAATPIPFRLIEIERGLRLELPNDVGEEEVDRMKAALRQCEAHLASLSRKVDFEWECQISAQPRRPLRTRTLRGRTL